ncbi:hypothetical protein M949_1144 [Riemerella anatipestifer CH3]|nr:hypothetical protein M949_1144 [Riemerella anatipestifer CH3]
MNSLKNEFFLFFLILFIQKRLYLFFSFFPISKTTKFKFQTLFGTV